MPSFEYGEIDASTYDALCDLVEPVNAKGQRQCKRCGAQWRATRYGLELSPQTIFGAPLFTCPDCAATRRR